MTQVMAHFATDDGAYTCDFDATPYFEAAFVNGELEAIVAGLAAIGFGHNYEADAIAYDAEAREPIISAGIGHCEQAMAEAEAEGLDRWAGFEVEVAIPSLRAYLTERAPELVRLVG